LDCKLEGIIKETVKIKSRLFLMVMGLMLVLFSYSSAQVPQMINYQGKLTNASGAPVNDTLQMVFSIYSDTGGTNLLWTETQPAVIVDKGVFNVLLGSVDSIPYSVFDGSIRYLGVKVESDPEITPRNPMVSVGYAYKSLETDNVIFEWTGSEGFYDQSKDDGLILSTSLVDVITDGKYEYLRVLAGGSHAGGDKGTIVKNSKFKKIDGISTISIYARLWCNNFNGDDNAVLTVDIGSTSGSVSSTPNSSIPTWYTADINVSSLTNNTIYDITIYLKDSVAQEGYFAYCSVIILIASS
jgi:hypothetical protein